MTTAATMSAATTATTAATAAATTVTTAAAAAAVPFAAWKQSRHSTGRPEVGWNGTSVSRPHCEQTAGYIVFSGRP